MCSYPNVNLRVCDVVDTDCPISDVTPFPWPPTSTPYRADYTSFTEALTYLDALDDPAFYPDDLIEFTTINLPLVGYIDDSGSAYSMSFPLVKLSTNASWSPDDAKPDVLITCGTHPREWMTSESCMAFIDRMVKEMYEPVPNPDVVDLLSHFEIWVVPFVTPGGRVYDDDDYGSYGDPTIHRSWRKNRQWFQVFDCASDWDTRPFSGNCNTAKLENHYGVNVARDFSVGWDQYLPAGTGERCLDMSVPSVPVPCVFGGVPNDAYCVDVGNGAVPWFSFITTSCQFNPRLVCDSTGVCSYSRRDTCCDSDFKGLRPFESLEARVIRHILLNIPIVTVLEAHSFAGVMGRVLKGGPNDDARPVTANYRRTFADENGPISIDQAEMGLDASNMSYVHRGAVQAYNEGAAEAWSEASGQAAADMPDFLKMATQIWSVGSGAGQLAGWAAGQAEEDAAAPAAFGSGIEANFDTETFRGINAYNVELPPRSGVDPTSLLTTPPPHLTYNQSLDFAEHNDCDTTFTGSCLYPDSQLSVRATTAGFIAMARYVIRDAAHPNIGRDRDGGHFDDALAIAFSVTDDGASPYRFFDRRSGTFPDPTFYPLPTFERMDTAVVGLQIHDGEGRGVLQGELDMDEIEYEYTAKVFLPAGNWAVSSDVVYENYRDPSTGVLPWDTNYQLTISLNPLSTSTSTGCTAQSHVFDTDTIFGTTIPPGDAGDRRYTRRFEFLTGCDYLVTAELTMANDNDTPVNDIRTLKVSTTGCMSGPRPVHLNEDEYCNRRIHEDAFYDSEEFACVGVEGTCKQCFLEDAVFADCGAGEFCVNGMCDDPYECWSGGIEDAFESGISIMGAADMNVAGDHEFSFSGTLHKDSGARDTDVVSWSAYEGTLPELLHYHKRIDLLVTDQCESPTAAGDPYDDIEVHVALVQGAYPYSTLSVEELLPWSTPASDTPFAIELSAAQRVEVREGAHIVVGLRNVEDPLIPGVFPSLSYTAVVSIGAGSPALLGSTKASIPTRGYVRVSDAAAARSSGGEVHRFTLSDEKIAGAELVYLRPRSALVAPEDAPQMIVADSGHETVSVATVDQHGGVSVSLGRLDRRYGPFEIVLAARRTALDGELYYCPAADPGDCFDLEVDRLCGGGICAEDEICCELDPNSGSDCVDAENDPENCGWCGHTCAANKRCQFGLCVPRWGEKCGATCTGDKTCCYTLLGGNQCVNTASNQLNCGKCGNVCGLGETCSGGKCVPLLSVVNPCWGGRTNCAAPDWIDCHNLLADRADCGACRLACPGGSACVNGRCADPGEEGIPDNCGEQR